MENRGINEILGTAGYMTALAGNYSLATHYSGVVHPSEGNYVAMIAGDTYGMTSDCGYCPWRSSALNLVDRLEEKGLTWQAYAEDASGSGTCGFSPPRGGDHFAFISFTDINTPARCSRLLAASSGDPEVTASLNSADAPNFLWLTPNDCNNMHDCSISAGDSYLANLVPQILNSNAFKGNDSVLFIAFDEGLGIYPDDNVYAVWVGNAVKKGFISTAAFSHYSFLKTLEDIWNLTSLTAKDASANSMKDLFMQPPVNATLGFSNADWYINNCNGAGTGTENIANGILQTREVAPSGSDNNYGYCSALRGSFPWGSTVGTLLPSGISEVKVNLTLLNAQLLPGSRYHLYIALYYQIPLLPAGGSSYAWLDTQSRVENINGVNSPVGRTETYNPGDSFGYDRVALQVDPGQSGILTANVQQLCQGDLAAWSLPLATPCTLKGIEIGSEGFHIQQLDADWASLTIS